MTDREKDEEIARIQARLKSLAAERSELQDRLAELRRQPFLLPDVGHSLSTVERPHVTAASSTTEKVELFRSLFVGRSDVFPVRWENRRTNKAGYAPACANEWAKEICGKPRVKCGECPHQAFIPVSDEMIRKHLRGGDSRQRSSDQFVAGVYQIE